MVDLDFEAFVQAVQTELPADVAEQMVAGLRRRHDKPPLVDFELCLGRGVPLAEARQILFYPGEEDMRLYPQLLAMPPAGAPDDHPQLRCQITAMASLYLAHSKSWRLVKPFIEAGGLAALAAVLAHSNLYLASQALSTFLAITDEELVFPWHEPPPTPDGRGPAQGPYALAWRRMYELSVTPLIQNLLRHQPDTFPGSGTLALRLLAFYASWLRQNFATDGVLRLSQALLDRLQAWSTEGAAEEERLLAQQLYDDFSRFPPAQASAQLGASGAETSNLGGFDDGDGGDGSGAAANDAAAGGDGVRVSSVRTMINSGPSADNEAEQLSVRGDEAMRRGDLTAAIHSYSSALDSLVPAARLLSEAPRRAMYHTSRATAYIQRADGGRMQQGDCDTSGHLDGLDHGDASAAVQHYEAAVIDCNMALDLDPACAPACLTKSLALQRLGRTEEAAAAARSGLDRLPTTSGVLHSELQTQLLALQSVAAGAPRAAQMRPPPTQAAEDARATVVVAPCGVDTAKVAAACGAAAAPSAQQHAGVVPATTGLSGGHGSDAWNEMD